jgi:aminoglycoside phosphotransferase (APT) family kinase protein
MDFIEGETLAKLWPDMSADEKSDIARQLKVIVTAMRSLEPDAPGVHSCGGGPITEFRTHAEYTGGPFPDEAAFNDWLVEGLHKATPVVLREECRKRLRSDHRITFTHGDLTPDNIIVKDCKIVGLVDWEYGGWYPEYWDFVKFYARPSVGQGWYDYASEIFPQAYFDDVFLYQFFARYRAP